MAGCGANCSCKLTKKVTQEDLRREAEKLGELPPSLAESFWAKDPTNRYSMALELLMDEGLYSTLQKLEALAA